MDGSFKRTYTIEDCKYYNPYLQTPTELRRARRSLANRLYLEVDNARTGEDKQQAYANYEKRVEKLDMLQQYLQGEIDFNEYKNYIDNLRGDENDD